MLQSCLVLLKPKQVLNQCLPRRGKRATSIKLEDLLITMPKDSTSMTPTPKERAVGKKRAYMSSMRQNAVTRTCYFQTLGTNLPGGGRSLILRTDFSSYFFNCGETTQKLICEYSVAKAMSNTTAFFATSSTWQNLGGFPGLCLFLRENGTPDLSVYGPKGTMALVGTVRHFLCLYEFDLVYKKDRYQDGSITVDSVPLDYQGPKVISPVPRYGPWVTAKNSGPRPPIPYSSEEKDEAGEINQTVNMYVVTIQGKAGQLDMAKCLELGIQPGPHLAELKAGKDLTVDGKILVRSKDVVGQKEPDKRCFVVDCPNEYYLDSLLNNTQLNELMSEGYVMPYVFHWTSPEMMQSDKYRQWMDRFGSDTTHVLMGQESKSYKSLSLNYYVQQLAKIGPPLFPHLANRPDPPTQVEIKDAKIATSGETFAIRNCDALEKAGKDIPDQLTLGNDFYSQEEIEEALKEAEDIMKPDLSQPEYPKIVFLGTGSSMSSKYRGNSGILVETSKDNFVLLDCGEGTANQIYEHFGLERAQDVLRNIKIIYISHLHADHHMGLSGLLIERIKCFKARSQDVKKVYVLGPARLASFLTNYHKEFEPLITDAEQVRNEHLILSTAPGHERKFQRCYPGTLNAIQDYAGLKQFLTCQAIHCGSSFCMTMTFEVNGKDFKLAYSGDTRPNDKFIEIGLFQTPPDLLIHEGTMQHSLLGHAKKKRHSTMQEAIQVGKDMGAKFTIVTHFSQRYAKMVPFSEVDMEGVGVAWDHMCVTPQTFKCIRGMYKAMEMTFQSEFREMNYRVDRALDDFNIAKVADKIIEEVTQVSKRPKLESDMKQ